MQLRERFPDQKTSLGHEVFDHTLFSHGTPAQRQEIMHRLSSSRYELERRNPFESYFGLDLTPFLKGSTVLDLGCFAGGAAIAWMERYGIERMYGVDVRDIYVQAAQRFAVSKKVNAHFAASIGEALPFNDNCFDVVLSFDVFEHVRSVRKVMGECCRILRPGGMLLLVFPGYFHPTEHHLSMVTLTPCLHWFFSGEDLIEAYNGVLDQRGEEARWYARSSRCLQPWERCNTINGMEVNEFRCLVHEMEWQVVLDRRLPLLGAGQIVKRAPVLRVVPLVSRILMRLPFLEEFLSHRIVYILRKPPLSAVQK